jgi:integrase
MQNKNFEVMPKKTPHALPWAMFEALLERVYQLAQQPGNEHQYRFLIFAATVAHYGLPTHVVLCWRWLFVGVDLIDVLPKARAITTTSTFKKDTVDVVLTIEVNLDYLKIAHKAFVLAYPSYVGNPVVKEDPVLLKYIVPSLSSDGMKPISHSSLNQFLASTAAKVGFNPDDISTLALRKTWARHWYDQQGQTKKMLTEIKKHFNQKTLAHTKRFIAFASEKGSPPVY